MQHVRRGCFLIANPSLRDPNFCRTVVLLCEHGEEGSMGLVINRPTEYSLEEALSGLDLGTDQRLWWGGPVQNQVALVLHRDVAGASGAREVVGGIGLVADTDSLQLLLRDSSPLERQVRVFSGYAGWGSGQLLDEMREGSWFVAPVRADLVFDFEPENVWAEALKLLGARYEFLATMPLDPRVN